MDKMALRALHLQQRRAISPATRQAVSRALVHHWQHGPFNQPHLRIGSYLATRYECPTQDLHQWSWQHHQSLFVPVVSHLEPGLVAYQADSHLTPTAYADILEPQDGQRICVSDLDVLLLPLLAIDAQGYRLGYGSGYYDRLLEHQRPPCLIGVGYLAQYCATLPQDAWDIPLDGFLCENGWLFFAQAQCPV
jgi:5-formyltetrahydrofolate cyclo-ligase